MSQENVEFAQGVFDRWNAGERRFPDEEIHPDVELVSRILGTAVRGRAGVAFDQPVGILFEIRDGQLLRFEAFLDDPIDALKAAGLRE